MTTVGTDQRAVVPTGLLDLVVLLAALGFALIVRRYSAAAAMSALALAAVATGWRPARPGPRALAWGLVGATVLLAGPVVRMAAASGAFAVPAARGFAGFVPWGGAVVLVVCAEEAFLRGALWAACERRAGAAVALAVSTGAFALLHVPLYGWGALPLDTLVGALLGGLRIVSGSVAAPGIAHLAAGLGGVVAGLTVLRARRRFGLGILAVLVPGALLLGGWGAGVFAGAPPVYDGLPLSVEPYRYLQPPPGFATTAKPTSARQTITTARPGHGQTIMLNTRESTPQAELLFTTSAFPDAGAKLTLRITAVLPPLRPRRGRIDGNVYEFNAIAGTASPGISPEQVGLRPTQTVTVVLRATGAPGTPALDRLDGNDWRALPTTQVPPYQYAARSDRLGDFALVIPPGSAAAIGAQRAALAGILGGFVLVLVVVLVLVLRRSGRRRAAAGPRRRPSSSSGTRGPPNRQRPGA